MSFLLEPLQFQIIPHQSYSLGALSKRLAALAEKFGNKKGLHNLSEGYNLLPEREKYLTGGGISGISDVVGIGFESLDIYFGAESLLALKEKPTYPVYFSNWEKAKHCPIAENEQFMLESNYVHIVSGLFLLEPGGTFIGRILHFLDPFNISLIGIFSSLFNKTYIDCVNKKCYLVGIGFKGMSPAIEKLFILHADILNKDLMVAKKFLLGSNFLKSFENAAFNIYASLDKGG